MLFVITGPSGSGKTSLIKAAVAADPRLRFSVSCTTRPQRESETHGKDYYFLTKEEFEQVGAKAGFLEWAEVHGNLYGTPRAELARAALARKDLVLDIDCAGAAQVRESHEDAHFIFILPSSRSTLEQRLRGRKDTPELAIERRLANAPA